MQLSKNVFYVLFAGGISMLVACNPGSKGAGSDGFSMDTTVIAAGEASFGKNCKSCHGFLQDGIGPQLGGITEKFSAEWLIRFIKNPAEIIASGDKDAQQLHEKYKAIMPSFQAMDDAELNAIVSFLHTKKNTAVAADSDSTAIANPFPQPIPFSDITINLKPLMQIPASAKTAPLARITKLVAQPGTGDLCILDLRGKLYKVINNQPVVYMDISKLRPRFIEQPGLGSGFGSFAFHPDFQKNGLLYTTHTEPAGSAPADFKYSDSIKVALQWVLTEWKASDPKSPVFSGTGREILRVNFVSVIHGMQEIVFNPYAKPGDKDYGMLYVCNGDGGSVEHGYPLIPHNPSHIWGTVIRIDPRGNNSRNKQYGIPAGNPFVNSPDGSRLKEIYCYGFRNPHRISWTKAGEMLVFNIGQHEVESIYSVKPGQDCGWPIREGIFSVNPYGNINTVHPLPADDSVYHITYPIASFDHDEGNAISGGYEYTGPSIAMLKGKIVFGDIPSGRVFYIESNDDKPGKMAAIKGLHIAINGNPGTLTKACGNKRVEIRFGEDAAGELYVLTKADGKVYKVTGAATTR
jgi:glucose/arabinose dehydrogenase